jgi:hypothetical protein
MQSSLISNQTYPTADTGNGACDCNANEENDDNILHFVYCFSGTYSLVPGQEISIVFYWNEE